MYLFKNIVIVGRKPIVTIKILKTNGCMWYGYVETSLVGKIFPAKN